MKKHVAIIFCLLLAGCSEGDWNRALNYTGIGGEDADTTADAVQPSASTSSAATATPVQAPVQEAPNNDLCRAVATQDATSNDFDPPTQQRVFARSYAQCLAIYTR
jgi:hypothetical protein